MFSSDRLSGRFSRFLRRKPSDSSLIRPPATLTPTQSKDLLYKTCTNETSSTNACEELENFSYAPLLTTTPHIRLLRIHTVAPALVVCSLDIHALSDVVGKFDALSYTWGTESFTAEIACNGQKLCITPSLEGILRQLYSYQVRTQALARGTQNTDFLYWIDALSLNQSDHQEIKAQIPLMGQIYSEARSTFAYLGKSTTGSDLAFEAIPRIRSILKKIKVKKGPAIVALSKSIYPIGHEIWDHFGDLSRRSWCERLWILQEVVLARHVLFGCGDFWVSGHDFLGVYRDLQNLGIDSVLQMPTAANPLPDNFPPLRGVFLMADTVTTYGRTEGMREFLNLMHVTRSRLCTEPTDRIYGILGLLGSKLQTEIREQILIEETQAERSQYWNMYARLANFCLQRDSTALGKILQSAAAVSRPEGLPSWCPNWASKPPYSPYSLGGYKTGGVFPSLAPAKQLPPISIQSKDLHLKGFRIDTIKQIAPDCDFLNKNGSTNSRDPGYPAEQATKILQWESACLGLTREVLNIPGDSFIPREFWMALIGGEIRLDANSPFEGASLPEMYRAWRFCIGLVASPILNNASNSAFFQQNSARVLIFSQALFAFCLGRRFVTTVGGRVGMVGGGVKVGDEVVVVYGAGPLFLVRFEGEVGGGGGEGAGNGNGFGAEAGGDKKEGRRARLVGDAYFHGRMEEHEVRFCKWRGEDEEFILV